MRSYKKKEFGSASKPNYIWAESQMWSSASKVDKVTEQWRNETKDIPEKKKMNMWFYMEMYASPSI